MAITEILPGIHYVGVNDRTTTRFEALWSLPMGVSYNAYLVAGEKIALIDTVEESFGSRLEANIREAIGERKWLYRPSVLRKSGMPLSVDTPAPPKKTMLSEFFTMSTNFSIFVIVITPFIHYMCLSITAGPTGCGTPCRGRWQWLPVSAGLHRR